MKFKLFSVFISAVILLSTAPIHAASIMYNFTGELTNGEATVNISLLWDDQTGGIAEGSVYVSPFRSYASNMLYLDSVSNSQISFSGDSSVTTTYYMGLYGIFYDRSPADYEFDARTHIITNSYGHPSFNVRIDPDSVVAAAYDEPSPVPVPAAVWLFGSGLIGLLGFTRRKQV